LVLDLYEGRWEGVTLGDEEYVISADEKTSIQARRRPNPTLPADEGRKTRLEHEYERKGALWPIWPPGMSIAPSSLAAAKRKMGSSPSVGW
jgi:hypothetical protein